MKNIITRHTFITSRAWRVVRLLVLCISAAMPVQASIPDTLGSRDPEASRVFRDSVRAESMEQVRRVLDKITTDTTDKRRDRIERFAERVAERVAEFQDSNTRHPKFIQFCLTTYNWINRNLNSYDTLYVAPTGKHGKVRILSDNWNDSYYFRMHDGAEIIMSSNPYSNLGIQANFSILSVSFTKDIGTLFNGRKSHHKKAGVTLSWAKLYVDGSYWRNRGSTIIRRYKTAEGKTESANHNFGGLNFKAYGLNAYWIFNGRKFSLAAAYNLSNYQRRTAGSWLAGISVSFYKADFDLAGFPANLLEDADLPTLDYRMNYHSYTLSGGYGLNVVMGRHWLANLTWLPGVGLARSRITFENRHNVHFALSARAMQSLTYMHRQFFATATFSFNSSYFLTDNFGFMPGVTNFQVSTGVRF